MNGRIVPLCRLALLGPLVVVMALAASCLGALPNDRQARIVAGAPHDVLEKASVRVRSARVYWLLRSEGGWRGSYEARYGGDAGDPGLMLARSVRFATEEDAARGYARLTPAYIYSALRDDMAGPGYAFDYPGQLPGDAATAWLYPVQLPAEEEASELMGQFTALRAGRFVMLVQSIGIDPPVLIPAIQAMVDAATTAR